MSRLLASPSAVLAFLTLLLGVSCSTPQPPTATLNPYQPAPAPPPEPTFAVYDELYAAATPSETRIEISLSAQSATLFNGDGIPILESDVSTGIPGHETPPGKYQVLERIVNKRSNLYGSYVDKETGTVTISQAWTHEGPPPSGSVYEGTAMPYWMRLTWSGVGMHVGKFQPSNPSSFGCIRVPEAVQPLIYEKTRMGTKVTIVP